jgi:hypothetical protein
MSRAGVAVSALDCGHEPSKHGPHTTGYGVTADGKKHCYACCAAQDRAAMIRDGVATLYLVTRDVPASYGSGVSRQHFVTNWPGSLRFRTIGAPVKAPRGGGFGSQRTDAWFRGPDGKVWHAVNRGDMDIARCRRLKRQPRA